MLLQIEDYIPVFIVYIFKTVLFLRFHLSFCEYADLCQVCTVVHFTHQEIKNKLIFFSPKNYLQGGKYN